MTATPDWRPVIAALANPHARTVWARVVLGDPEPLRGLSAARAAQVMTTLRGVGLVRADDAAWVATPETLTALLAAGAAPPRLGVERFLRGGRIETYPAAPGERREVLAWVAERAVQEGEELTEQGVNDRLAPFHDDVVTLRRYLVDAGLLTRTPTGSSYTRPAVRRP